MAAKHLCTLQVTDRRLRTAIPSCVRGFSAQSDDMHSPAVCLGAIPFDEIDSPNGHPACLTKTRVVANILQFVIKGDCHEQYAC